MPRLASLTSQILTGITSSGGDLFATTDNPSTATLLYSIDNPNLYSTPQQDNMGTENLSVDGYNLLVGVPNEDNADGSASGAAYLFDLETGNLVRTFVNPNAFGTVAGDNFGEGVAVKGNYAVIGAPDEDDETGTSSGKAYIYDLTTGALLHTLDNPNLSPTPGYDRFGNYVAINSTTAFVSAYREANNFGRIYAYDLATGSLLYNIINPEFTTLIGGVNYGNLFFGVDMTADDNYLVVGQRQYANSAGRVYVYNPSTGSQIRVIENPNPFATSENDNFGYGVALSKGYFVSGSTESNGYVVGTTYVYYYPYTGYATTTSPDTAGAAYVYDVATGNLVSSMINPNPDGAGLSPPFVNDNFSERSVAISDNVVAVGANSEDQDGTSAGKVYVFDRATGTLLITVDNPNDYDTPVNDNFGQKVAISGNYLIVSAPFEDDAEGLNSGKIYVFELS